MIRSVVVALLMASGASAEVVVPSRTIPARTLIAVGDLTFRDMDMPGAFSDPTEIIGQEARVALYAGRPIMPGNLGPPAIVERNQIIPLIYQGENLTISAEGRALGRAGPGENLRVMNLASRNTVTARLDDNGTAHVTQ